MSYLVLARKWRPRSFDTLVGQDHVVRALTHALTTQRLHHAWLFTGTRGVGKTTLSRILAKSLNCETGITATPCGVCQACTEIDQGRFVDYLELDAASNRGVDEMTQLLEQAVYSPSAGRFKVYMIDEVHMLTGHAFNAMLKTLEEPPAHVKFILATTDPQKIPVTVLSRCLQFNLKQMPGEAIVGHLENVLGHEQIPFEVPALRLLGQAAAGSMRDALSLTDQAIAYSASNLTEEAVRGMLGTIDQRHLVRLLEALQSGQAPAVLEIADELATRGLSYRAALADLAVLLSRIAIAQRVSAAVDEADPIAIDIRKFASALHPDVVQLFYTVAVHSRSELAIAPDEYAGFVMACLRMLSLGGTSGFAMPAPDATSQTNTAVPVETRAAVATPPAAPAPKLSAAPASVVAAPAPHPSPELDSEQEPDEGVDFQDAGEHDEYTLSPADFQRMHAAADEQEMGLNPVAVVAPVTQIHSDTIILPEPWGAFAAKLPLSGMSEQLARQSECVAVSKQQLTLRVPSKALSEGPPVERLRTVLSDYFGFKVELLFEIGAGEGSSAHALDLVAQQARQDAAEVAIDQDPFVQALIQDFGAKVVPGSIRPSQLN
ncbi:MAG: DNA polymerase III subunit gamma/tau [Burkholderiaceae bacterium]|nr:DNA polymerase III subunit gamma/tau [Burkholderiaceae bacterium]